MAAETLSAEDAFGLRDRELRVGSAPPEVGRHEVRAVVGRGLGPLREALRGVGARMAWIASQLPVPPLLDLFEELDPERRLRVELIAAFDDGCFVHPGSRRLAALLDRWSEAWETRFLEGPSYPGHVFVVDDRLLLCRDGLVDPEPSHAEWVEVELSALPSLKRRLRRRRAACQVVPPPAPPLGETGKSVSALLGPAPTSATQRARRERLLQLLVEPDPAHR